MSTSPSPTAKKTSRQNRSRVTADDLALLQTRGLLHLTTHTEPRVRFKHALTREATYALILQSRRMELHRAAAETLAALYPQPDLEMALTIAEHWHSGGEDARAVEAILPHASGLNNSGRSTSLTALLLRLDRARLPETRARDLDLALADAHTARGEYEEAQKLYALVLPEADTLTLRTRLLHSLGVTVSYLGDYQAAIQYYSQSLELAETSGNLSQQAQAAGGLGLVYLRLGDAVSAEKYLLLSREQSLRVGDSLELANAEHNLAGILMEQGSYDRALELATHALTLYEKFGHAQLAVRTTQLLGACYYSMGDLNRAETFYSKSIQRSREIGNSLDLTIGLTNLAELYTERKQSAAAVAAYEEAIKYAKKYRYEYFLAASLVGLARAQLQSSDTATRALNRQELVRKAKQSGEEGLEIARRLHTVEPEGIALGILAEVSMREGDPAGAKEFAERAVELLEAGGSVLEVKRVYQTYGQILSTSADPEQRARGAQYLERAQKGT